MTYVEKTGIILLLPSSRIPLVGTVTVTECGSFDNPLEETRSGIEAQPAVLPFVPNQFSLIVAIALLALLCMHQLPV